MNYRHQYHAGNFADVMKHVLLLQIARGMQRKDKAFLYLDTHAGRGRYDLAGAAQGDSLARKPEWPEGIGRLWTAETLSPALIDYLARIRAFDTECGGATDATIPSFYPGSPLIVGRLARPQDRLVLCEKHPEECEILRNEMSQFPRSYVHDLDGYTALRAMLPPPEKRALVLIDPPYEAQNEFSLVVTGLGEALRRLPAATLVVWYPLTERARIDAFFDGLSSLHLPPTWTAELCIAGEFSGLKMRGCGMLVVNPPWKLDLEVQPILIQLASLLALDSGAGSRLEWLVPEQ